MKKTWWIVIAILLVDQLSKIWVKTQMLLHEKIVILDWFHIHFVENNGMAFGTEFLPKIVLSLFRIVMIGGLIWLLRKMYQKNAPGIITTAFSMVLAGAIGNILDGMFYGVLFTESTPFSLANFTSSEGYSSFLYGKVVDMLSFPLWEGTLPNWIPFVGGSYYEFFRYIFNIADSAITVAFFILLIYNKKMSQAFRLIEKK
ncbi:MAG: lipoprotein signal peptidase [Flavobacteriales bacterium]|nr:lipoprotein signal peptidase [Flavobacteriales bacterium]